LTFATNLEYVCSEEQQAQIRYGRPEEIEKSGREAFLTVSLGTQNSVLYNIELNTSSPSFLLKRSLADK
jgi:hypothetical protein